MTQNAHVPTREPVSDILSEAARLCLKPQPGNLPSGVKCLHAAIDATLDPLRRVKEQLRRRIALDTTGSMTSEQAGEPLVPATVHRLERPIARCFALHGVPRSYAPRAFKSLAFFRGGGIPTSSLKDLAKPVRDEHTHRPHGDSADYLALARRHDPAPGASARSSTPVEPLAAAELHPNSEEEITTPLLNLHTALAGRR